MSGPAPADTAPPAHAAPNAAPTTNGAPPQVTNGASVEAGPVGRTNGHATSNSYSNGNAPTNGNAHTNGNGHAGQNGAERAGCTAPQLRRFIKSRPYVPMHELRRRFAIDGNDDDVTPVDLDGSKVFVGLPSREGSLLGELLRGGEIGYELSFDPRAPIVVGVYPMRPVPRS